MISTDKFEQITKKFRYLTLYYILRLTTSQEIIQKMRQIKYANYYFTFDGNLHLLRFLIQLFYQNMENITLMESITKIELSGKFFWKDVHTESRQAYGNQHQNLSKMYVSRNVSFHMAVEISLTRFNIKNDKNGENKK